MRIRDRHLPLRRIASELGLKPTTLADVLERLQTGGNRLVEFTRGRKATGKLTDAGFALLAATEVMLATVERHFRRDDELRVACPASLLSSELFIPVIRAYRDEADKAPRPRLRFHPDLDVDAIRDGLRSGALDLAFVWEPTARSMLNEPREKREHWVPVTNTIHRPFDVVVVARTRHEVEALAEDGGDGRPDLSKLKSRRLFLMDSEQLLLSQYLPEHGGRDGGSFEIGSSIDTILAFVRAGQGLGLCPALPVLTRHQRAGELYASRPIDRVKLVAVYPPAPSADAGPPRRWQVAEELRKMVEEEVAALPDYSAGTTSVARRTIPEDPARYLGGSKWSYFVEQDVKGGGTHRWIEERLYFRAEKGDRGKVAGAGTAWGTVTRFAVTFRNVFYGAPRTYIGEARLFQDMFLTFMVRNRKDAHDGFVAVMNDYVAVPAGLGEPDGQPERFAWLGHWFGIGPNGKGLYAMLISDRRLADADVHRLASLATINHFMTAEQILRYKAGAS